MEAAALRDWIEQEIGYHLLGARGIPVAGGCINEARWFETEEGIPLFVKVNQASRLDLFDKEARGLKLLKEAGKIRVPSVYGRGIVDRNAVHVLEGIPMAHSTRAENQQRLGRELAALHQCPSPDGHFGSNFDNHIGSTRQVNAPHSDWTEFFLVNRIGFQLDLAVENGWKIADRDELFTALTRLLGEHQPEAVLLHGDLWSGNYCFDESGAPVLFDPACYFGDRETDLAFTRMFGGFSAEFYRAYREIHPAPHNVEPLHLLYNLYHELNHFNLFGGGYGIQARETIACLLEFS